MGLWYSRLKDLGWNLEVPPAPEVLRRVKAKFAVLHHPRHRIVEIKWFPLQEKQKQTAALSIKRLDSNLTTLQLRNVPKNRGDYSAAPVGPTI